MSSNETGRPGWRTGAAEGVSPDTHSVTEVAAILAQIDCNTDDWWRSCALAGLEYLAATARPFTAYDLTSLGVPEPQHPNQWGPVMSTAAHAGMIRHAGYVPSLRPSVHRSVVRQWIGAQAAKDGHR